MRIGRVGYGCPDAVSAADATPQTSSEDMTAVDTTRKVFIWMLRLDFERRKRRVPPLLQLMFHFL
jgi:hypothetical protein